MTNALILFPLSASSLARLRLLGVVRSREIAEREGWSEWERQHLADEQYDRMDRIERGMTP